MVFGDLVRRPLVAISSSDTLRISVLAYADTIKQVSEELGISQADVIHELVDNYRQA